MSSFSNNSKKNVVMGVPSYHNGNPSSTVVPGAFQATGGRRGQHRSEENLATKATVVPISKSDTDPTTLDHPDKKLTDEKNVCSGRWVWPTAIAATILITVAIGAGVGVAFANRQKSDDQPQTDQPNHVKSCSLAQVESKCQTSVSLSSSDIPTCIEQHVDEVHDILEQASADELSFLGSSMVSCSAENLAVLKLAELVEDEPNQSDLSMLQRFVLNTFYYEMSGNGWVDDGNLFDASMTECESPFVECNSAGEIESLVIDDNRLDGSLPSTVGLLTRMSKY
jgi:hypothetical protein